MEKCEYILETESAANVNNPTYKCELCVLRKLKISKIKSFEMTNELCIPIYCLYNYVKRQNLKWIAYVTNHTGLKTSVMTRNGNREKKTQTETKTQLGE